MEIKLNQQQEEVVHAKENKIVVTAGPGTGKTTMLTERVRYLLSNLVNPEKIVCITFTNAAADEMRNRLSNVEGIDDVFIGTIHSYANKILQHTSEVYEILSDERSLTIHKEIIERFCTSITYQDFRDMNEAIDEYVIHHVHEVNDFRREQWEEFNKIEYGYPLTMKDIIERDHLITFDEIIQRVLSYLKERGGNIQYLMVDEFQDVGSLEYSFLKGLEAENYFYVGDYNQSIYGFKDSKPEIMLSLVKNPEWKAYSVNLNYRTSLNIAKKAKSVISPISNVDIMNGLVRNTSGTVINDYKNNLGRYISLIKNSNDKNTSKKYGEWFILTRSNRDINVVAEALEKERVPYLILRRTNLNFDELQQIMSENKVKVMTVHASKGLENNNVIVYGDTSVWFSNRGKVRMDKAEELRIMYVAFTRARDSLIILK